MSVDYESSTDDTCSIISCQDVDCEGQVAKKKSYSTPAGMMSIPTLGLAYQLPAKKITGQTTSNKPPQ